MRILLAILAAFVGMSCMALVVSLVEALGHAAFPASPEMIAALEKLQAGDPTANEAMEAALPTMPAGSFASIVLAWILGAMAGPGCAAVVHGAFTRTLTPATCRRFGIFFAALMLASCLANLLTIPSPAWMVAAGAVLPPAAALWVGFRMAANRSAPAASS